MTNQTAITPYQRVLDHFRSAGVQDQFRAILGKRAQSFLSSMLAVIGTNNALAECDPQDLMKVALKAAATGLSLDPNLGQAYAIPYKRKDGTSEVNFQIGYRGLIILALNTGQYKIINAVEIYEGQRVIQDQLTGVIRLNGHRTGDTVIGYAAYFQLATGYENFEYMTREQVMKHAARYSQSYQADLKFKKEKSKWSDSVETHKMALKTVLIKLLKQGPLSADLQDAIENEEREPEQADDSELFHNPPDVVDAVARDPEPDPEPTQTVSREDAAAKMKTPKGAELGTLTPEQLQTIIGNANYSDDLKAAAQILIDAQKAEA